MKQLRTIFYVVKHSLFPTDNYYVTVRKNTSFWFSFKYIVSLVLIVSVVLTILYPLHFLPIYQPGKLKNEVLKTLGQLPDDFVLNINYYGVLTTNQQRPIIIFNQNNNSPKRFLVIDSLANDSMAKDYDSRIILMRRKAIIQSFDQTITFNYRDERPITINHQTIENITSIIEELFSYYWIILGGVMFILLLTIPTLLLISKILYLILASLIVFVVAKLFFIRQLSYKKTLQISMHAATAPIILEYTSMLFHISIPIKIWFFLLTLVFIAAGVYEAYASEIKNKSRTD